MAVCTGRAIMKKWVAGVLASCMILGIAGGFTFKNKVSGATPVLAQAPADFSLNTDAAQRYRKVQPKHWRAAMVKGFGHNAMR